MHKLPHRLDRPFLARDDVAAQVLLLGLLQQAQHRRITGAAHHVGQLSAVLRRAQARRLQPHFIGSFFREAFGLLGGRITERERGRYEITRVPSALKERDRLIGRTDPVLDRYARVTFEKALVPGQPQAELVAPVTPMFEMTPVCEDPSTPDFVVCLMQQGSHCSYL